MLPPLVAALRLPFALALGFVVIPLLDAVILLLASDIDSSSIKVSSFGWALLAAQVISALTVALQAIFGSTADPRRPEDVVAKLAEEAAAWGAAVGWPGRQT